MSVVRMCTANTEPVGAAGKTLLKHCKCMVLITSWQVQDPELQHGVQARRSGIIREGKGHIRTTCYSSRSASHCSL